MIKDILFGTLIGCAVWFGDFILGAGEFGFFTSPLVPILSGSLIGLVVGIFIKDRKKANSEMVSPPLKKNSLLSSVFRIFGLVSLIGFASLIVSLVFFHDSDFADSIAMLFGFFIIPGLIIFTPGFLIFLWIYRKFKK